MMMNPLVSIITPSLNQGEYISQAIDSVADQEYPNIEHLVVDGESSDNTISILKEREGQLSSWVSEIDTGTSDAINKGVMMSKGKYFWMINADDRFWDSKSVGALVEALEADPQADFAYGDMEIIGAAGEFIGQRRFGEYTVETLLTDRRYLPFPGCLMRRSTFDRIGGLLQELKFANDIEFYLRIAMTGRMIHVPRLTGVLRIHDHASTQANVRKSGDEVRQVCEEYLEKAWDSGKLVRPKRRVKAAIELFSASYNFHSANASGVRRHCFSAMRNDPGLLMNMKLWIYFFGSLLGNRGMDLLSKTLRRVVNRTGWFALNNSDRLVAR